MRCWKKAHEIQVRINTWISSKGTGQNYFGDFPYEALAPSINKHIMFNNIDDVYDELERLYDRAIDKSKAIGEALFISAGFFVDYEKLICNDIQLDIKKYIYSRISKTPPYTSVNETPASFIDDYIIIDEETQAISNSIEKDKNEKRNM